MNDAELTGEYIEPGTISQIEDEGVFEVVSLNSYHSGAEYERNVVIESPSNSTYTIHVKDVGDRDCALQEGDKIYLKGKYKAYNLKNI